MDRTVLHANAEFLTQLETEKQRIQDSLTDWTQRQKECIELLQRTQEQLVMAQRQIDIHNAHIERLDWCLNQLEPTTEQQKENG